MRGLKTYLQTQKLAKKGLTVSQIADKLGLHENTVKKYLRNKSGRKGTIPSNTRIRINTVKNQVGGKEPTK